VNKVASKRFDPERIRELFNEGFDDKRIALQLGHNAVNAWRTVQRIRIKNGWTRKRGVKKKPSNPVDNSSSPVNQNIKKTAIADFSRMNPDERVDFLRERFKKSARFSRFSKTMSEDEMEVFQEEYFNIIRDIDDVSLTEEQALFFAIYDLILAMRAQVRRQEEEDILDRCRSGEIPQVDLRYIVTIDDRWDKEYNSHIKSYKEFIDNLKLSRKQRLDKQKKTKKTILDFVVELADHDNQTSVAETIRQLEKESDAELSRLVENDLLLGYFEGAK